MTKKELIDALAEYPDETPIRISDRGDYMEPTDNLIIDRDALGPLIVILGQLSVLE